MYTVREAKDWADSLKGDLQKAFNEEGLPSMFYQGMFKDIMNAGYWLQQALRDHNFSEDEIKDIQFKQGQACFVSDPWKTTVDIVNKLVKRDTL